MAPETVKAVPLTCHGHSRPITHLSFSSVLDDDQYYLISACKDNNPMLRDGITGDWIGTFIGHKGAVWQARLSSDASLAATGSADFSAKIWDTHTGECLHTLTHGHIVRAVSFPSQPRPQLVATGGFEKKLRIFDLSRSLSSKSTSSFPSSPNDSGPSSPSPGYEVGPGIHEGNIKSVIWSADLNILITAADDKYVRWWDLRARTPAATHKLEGMLGTCELDSTSSTPSLSVAAGKSAYFFSGKEPGSLLKKITTTKEIAAVAYHADSRKFVTGGGGDTWVRVYDFDDETELEVQKGHHGPVWTVGFSPDGKLYATGSEDGTVKLWKFCSDPYGLWR
ncbi:MAG: hypothetical protein Q9207_001494 [Kuettlingeria erythrocarpa]